MPSLADLTSWIDQKKRLVGRNLSDLVSNPQAVGQQWASQLQQDIPQMIQDPANYMPGGGIGRTKVMDASGRELYSAPTQADLAGRLHSMGLVTPRGARDLYNLSGREALDPEFLRFIEEEAARRGKAMY